MSSILVELTATIVSAHAATVELSSEELLQEIQKVYATLKQLDTDEIMGEPTISREEPTTINPKKSIQKDQVICLLCGKGGFKTLTRHLKNSHGVQPADYRKQFNIPPGTPLTAKNFSEARRKTALENNLGEKMTQGRIKYQAEKAAAKAAAVTDPAAKKAGRKTR